MDALLDAADKLAETESERPSRPNFPIPEEFCNSQRTHELLELKDSSKKGKGWFARTNIPAGTVLIVSKPIGMVMEWEQDDEDDKDDDGCMDDDDVDDIVEEKINELLILQILKDIHKDPSLWTNTLSQMFPRHDEDVASVPAWKCPDEALLLRINASFQDLGKLEELKSEIDSISKRLPLIVRYNVLSIETCPELLSHPNPGGHSCLSAVGLYHLPSFFNHSARPNVSRWAIGDIMWFVTNQDVIQGKELCISYLEHDVLCENSQRRNILLRMDFSDSEDGEVEGEYDEEGPETPVVDSDVQNELMGMDPLERLGAIDELMQQASGMKLPESQEEEGMIDAMDEDGEDGNGSPWFACDIQNLRILKAITLYGLGQTSEALRLWEECVVFTETKLPPLDEASVAMRTQAALCSWHAGESHLAKEHAKVALATHNLIFGGGVARFRRRYQRDLRLSLRSVKKNINDHDAVDALWPLNM